MSGYDNFIIAGKRLKFMKNMADKKPNFNVNMAPFWNTAAMLRSLCKNCELETALKYLTTQRHLCAKINKFMIARNKCKKN